MPRHSRATTLLFGLCAALLFLSVLRSGSSPSPAAIRPCQAHFEGKCDETRILKASMLYGRPIELYEEALRTHERHNDIHGYAMQVLRQQIMEGYWNKLAYILSLLVEQLGKPKDERAEWIMYFDAPTILLNPLIPLSTFLPPSPAFSETHFLGARHLTGELCATSFFLRVHPWSIRLVTKMMAVPLIDPGAELGEDHQDAMAMAYILNETEFRDHALYQPRTWYNAEHVAEGGFEGRDGSLSVRYPALLEGERWKAIADTLNATRERPGRFEKSVEETGYREDAARFWEGVEEARRVVGEGEWEWVRRRDDGRQDDALGEAIVRLKEMVAFRAGEKEMVEKAMDEVQEGMKRPPPPPPPPPPKEEEVGPKEKGDGDERVR